jgi:hypothetical protein
MKNDLEIGREVWKLEGRFLNGTKVNTREKLGRGLENQALPDLTGFRRPVRSFCLPTCLTIIANTKWI